MSSNAEIAARRSAIDSVLSATVSGSLPFVAARLGEQESPVRVPRPEPADVLGTFYRAWRGIAEGWFFPAPRTVRGHVGELWDVRNRLAHTGGHVHGEFDDDDVQRASDTALRLLKAIRDGEFRQEWGAPPTRTVEAEVAEQARAAIAALGRISSSSEHDAYLAAVAEAAKYLDPRTTNARSSELQRAGERIGALAFAERAVALQRSIYTLNRLASARRAMGMLEGAEETARESLVSDSSSRNAPARIALAGILCDRGGQDGIAEAVAPCEGVLAGDPGNTYAANALRRAEALRGGVVDVDADLA